MTPPYQRINVMTMPMTHLASVPTHAIPLLVQLLQVMPDESTHERVYRWVTTGVDWDIFFDVAIEHRVLPLIHQRIQTHYVDVFPAEIQDELAAEVFDNGVRNRALSQALLAAIAHLRDRGIPALAFKGPTLATMVYGNFASRMFFDLDILVPADCFFEAKTILLEQGYESDIHCQFLITSELQEIQLLGQLGECPLHKSDLANPPNPPIHIDLHQRLVAGDFFQLAFPLESEIWQSSYSIDLLGTPVQTLGPEDLFLYLCIHGTKDLWKRLGWLCDLAVFLQPCAHPSQPSQWVQPIQWDIVLKKVNVYHLESIVGMSLALTKQLLGLPIPLGAQPLQAHPHHQTLIHHILTRLESPLPSSGLQFSLATRFWFRWQLLESSHDRWLCAIAFYRGLLTPTYVDTQLIRLPHALSDFYRVIRLMRLLKKGMIRG